MASPRPKVLLTNFHPQRDGGGGHMRHVWTLISSPLAREFELAVAAPEGSAVWATGRDAGLPTFACDFPGKLSEAPGVVRAVRRFEAIYRAWPSDLINMNGSRDQQIVVFWKRLFGRRVPCMRSHLAIRCIPSNAYNRWSYNRMVQGNVYICHTAKNISWAGGSLRPEHSRVIPNGVDLDFWRPVSKDPAYLTKLGITPTDFVFGSHAGMAPHKRTDLFLRAAAVALQRGARPFRVLLRGRAPEIEWSRSLAAELGLPNVVYLQHEPDPRGYLSVIDVGFVLSETIEALSYAARELMAMGKPLLSSNYAGLVENVDDGLNGRLVECGDVEGVAEAIHWFLDRSPEQLEQLRHHARQKAELVFDVRKQIEGTARFYREILGSAECQVPSAETKSRR
jgi:L-malate glycosyltransferase